MSEYDLLMKNRATNPQMHNCLFCDRRFAEGQSCCTPTLLWNASDNGPAAAAFREMDDGKHVKVYVVLTSAKKDWRKPVDHSRFRGKWPVCGQWRHHRWRGNKCKRCGATRKVKAVKPQVEELVEA